MFTKATKKQAKLRMSIHGASGAGKTYTALSIASNLGKRIALVDTERGSASKYADQFDFDVLEVNGNYHPKYFEEAVHAASDYDCLVIDSGTHVWKGPGGFLSLHDDECKRMAAKNGRMDTFIAWKAITPIYDRFVQSLLTAPMHVFITLRAKTEYVKEDKQVRKVGLTPEMRDDFQYEMDVEGLLDLDHSLTIGKTRCNALDGRVFSRPGKDLADILSRWLTDGVSYESRIARCNTLDELDVVASEMKSSGQGDDITRKAWLERKKALHAAMDNGAANSAVG
jgi:hypothetical protein